MKKLVGIAVASVLFMLAGCIVFPAGVQRAPSVAGHLPTATDDTQVLILRVRRISSKAGIAMEAPVLVKRGDTKALEWESVRLGLCVGAGIASCSVEPAYPDRIREVCLLWSDGRMVSLGDPQQQFWIRESRGRMTDARRAQLLLDLPNARILSMGEPYCPFAPAELNWTDEERKLVIDYLRVMSLEPGLGAGFFNEYMLTVPRAVPDVLSQLPADFAGDSGGSYLLLTRWHAITPDFNPRLWRAGQVEGKPAIVASADLEKLNDRLKLPRGAAVMPYHAPIERLVLAQACLVLTNGRWASFRWHHEGKLVRRETGRTTAGWRDEFLLDLEDKRPGVSSTEGECLGSPRFGPAGWWADGEKAGIAGFVRNLAIP